MPQQLLYGLLAARSAHGEFAAYYRRFKHEDADSNFVCVQENLRTHFIRCRRYVTLDRKLRKDVSMDTFIGQLLGTKFFEKLLEFARVTIFFFSNPGCI